MTPEEGYQEALRRIAEAKRSGAMELYLGGLSLKEIPVDLLNCQALQSLNLERVGESCLVLRLNTLQHDLNIS